MRPWKERLSALVGLAASIAAAACTSSATRINIESAESGADVRQTALSALRRAERGDGEKAAKAEALTDAALTGPLDMATVEAIAIARSPGFLAAARRVRALVERARAEGRMPPPELMSDVWQIPFKRPYAIHEAGMIMVSLRQVIPPLAALDKMAEATALSAQAEAAKALMEASSLVREVDKAFIDYAEGTARHAAHAAHKAVVEQMAAVARARYSTGAPLADVTRADLEVARASIDMERELAMIEEARAKLNGLCGRPTDAKLGEPRWGEPQTAALTPAGAEEAASTKSPEITMADRMALSARAESESASLMASVPMFMAGVSAFLPMADMPTGYGVSFSMSLPWVWGAESARARSAEQMALAESAAAADARRRARTESGMALAAVRGAVRRYVALSALAAPAAHRAELASKAGYEAGGAEILMWLDSARMVLEVELDRSMARADIDRALAELDWTLGSRAPRAPIPGLEGPRP